MDTTATALVPEWVSVPAEPAALDPAIWTESFRREEDGELSIDGRRVSELVREFGTPLYAYSEDTYRSRARGFRDAFRAAFAAQGAEVSVYYAGKAFLCSVVVRWAEEEGRAPHPSGSMRRSCRCCVLSSSSRSDFASASCFSASSLRPRRARSSPSW